MLAPIDRPVVCPVVIGRGQNLELLDGIVAATARGEGQTVLLAGGTKTERPTGDWGAPKSPFYSNKS